MSSAVAPRIRTRAHRPRLRVVPPPRPRHTLRYALLAILLAGAAVFGAVALNALAAGDAVRARELEARVAEAERQYDELVAEVAALEDPARIRAAALRLGMIPAEAPRYLHADRTVPGDEVEAELVEVGESTDPLKPVLSVQR